VKNLDEILCKIFKLPGNPSELELPRVYGNIHCSIRDNDLEDLKIILLNKIFYKVTTFKIGQSAAKFQLSPMGIIYIIKNIVNYKIYIGQTKSSVLKRWNGHMSSYRQFLKNPEHIKCIALNNAFKKYGLENFVIITFRDLDDDRLDDQEKHYIKVFGSISPNGYNIRKGGTGGGMFNEISRQKMSFAKLGEKNPNYGKNRSDEFKQIMHEKKSGIKHHFYGKNLSTEHLEKLSKSHKKDGDSKDLPMYMVYVKARPEHYCSEGYAIVNHPRLKNKYFTSKKLTLDEKFELTQEYLLLDN
jgi:group I intron endonuclease